MHQTFSIASNSLKQAWIVPQYQSVKIIDDWSYTTNFEFANLGELVSISSGQYIKSKDYSDKGIYYIRVDNIRNFVLNITKEDLVLIPNDYLTLVPERCVCKNGDVLISRTGTLGKAALFTGNEDQFIMSQHVTKLSVKNKNLNKILPGVSGGVKRYIPWRFESAMFFWHELCL